jgi:hypothetical protein
MKRHNNDRLHKECHSRIQTKVILHLQTMHTNRQGHHSRMLPLLLQHQQRINSHHRYKLCSQRRLPLQYRVQVLDQHLRLRYPKAG